MVEGDEREVIKKDADEESESFQVPMEDPIPRWALWIQEAQEAPALHGVPDVGRTDILLAMICDEINKVATDLELINYRLVRAEAQRAEQKLKDKGMDVDPVLK